MPEFLGRLNLPNQLANSLVQLAAAQEDPLAAGFREVGKLADSYTTSKRAENAMDAETKRREKEATTVFERQKEMKILDLAHEERSDQRKLVAELYKADRIKPAKQEFDMAAYESLAGKGGQGPTRKRSAPAEGSRASEDMGGILPPGLDVSPAKEIVTVDEAMAKQYKLPAAMVGKTLTADQFLWMKAGAERKSGSGGAAPKYADFLRIAASEADPGTPQEVISEMADSMYADAIRSQDKPGVLGKDATKAQAEANKPKTKKGLWASIFSAVAPDEAAAANDTAKIEPPKKEAPAAPDDEVAVRADFQAGKITKEQARKKIIGIRARKK